jgi:signal transduction histidine kinase
MMTDVYKIGRSPRVLGSVDPRMGRQAAKAERAGSVATFSTENCEVAMVGEVGTNVRGENSTLDEVADPLLIEFSLTSPTSIKTSRSVLGRKISIAEPLPTKIAPATQLVLTKEHSESASESSADMKIDRSIHTNSVDALTVGMVHDFNNLLMIVSGSLVILQKRLRDNNTADVDRHVSTAQDAIRRAAAVSRRLLCYSRKVADQVDILDVGSFVSGMEELIRRAVGPGIVVVFDVSTDASRVVVNPSQLESSLLNLCINAKDAMPGGGTIAVRSADQLLDPQVARDLGVSPGRYVSLRVSDNGSGMQVDEVSRAFEPFFSTKPVGAGTGLGLPMVKHFADHASGAVNIVSREGQGTDVTIYLPVSPAPIPQPSMV